MYISTLSLLFTKVQSYCPFFNGLAYWPNKKKSLHLFQDLCLRKQNTPRDPINLDLQPIETTVSVPTHIETTVSVPTPIETTVSIPTGITGTTKKNHQHNGTKRYIASLYLSFSDERRKPMLLTEYLSLFQQESQRKNKKITDTTEQ